MALAPIPMKTLEASNKAFVLPDIPHIGERVAEARALAAAHPEAEQAMVIDAKTGAVLWRSQGDAENVDIQGAYDKGLTAGNLIIHTHPKPAELSLPDVICATACDALGNMAVCADGTVSWTTGANKHQCGPETMRRAADLARHLAGAQQIEDIQGDATAIARDNYWIARTECHFGFVRGYWAHYSESLMSALSDTHQ